MSDYLFEIYGEEIPSRMQKLAVKQFEQLFHKELLEARLTYTRMESFVTPRRLAISIEGLPEKTTDYIEEKRGPRVDAYAKAIAAFAVSVGLTPEELLKKDTEKGAFYFAQFSHQGVLLSHILPSLAERVIRAFVWPKSMRWNCSEVSWVRPIHHGLSVLNGESLPFQVNLGGGVSISFGNSTRGHFFMSPDFVAVTTLNDYIDRLRHRYVMVDWHKRRESIQSQIDSLASSHGLKICEDDELLDEVTGMIEFPVPLLGEIDKTYMDLPRELLITVMRHHQRYFAVEEQNGQLAPYFVLVANRVPEDGGAQILEGNRRVLRARLNDARFFYDQDRKHPLSYFRERLTKMRFHAALGSMEDKVQRMETLAKGLAKALRADGDLVQRAAQLAKADLCTGMVYEFPELQGVMGRYYASNEVPEVAQAIEEHYLPNGAESGLPQTLTGTILSLADKVDSLVGFFGVEILPTGSKDPFALRRAALSIVRLLEQKALPLTLKELVHMAYEVYRDQSVLKKDPTIDVLEFFKDRLMVFWMEQGLRRDILQSLGDYMFDLPLDDLRQRAVVLQVFCGSPEGTNLLQGFLRAYNILEQQKEETIVDHVDPALLTFQAEKILFDALGAVEKKIQGKPLEEELQILSSMRHSIDGFFNTVIVNDPNPEVKRNRLALLQRIVTLMKRIADFTFIQA